MFKSITSQIVGLVVCLFVGFFVYQGVNAFLSTTLNFWHLGEILGLAAGTTLGGLAAYELFTRRIREVPINSVGIGKLFGSLTKVTFGDGRHWVPPFVEILTLAGPAEKFILEIPGEKIEAQDGTAIHFGIPENGGKANQIQYSILDPLTYILVDDPEKSLREAYMEAARLFFGQASEAAGVRNEGRLFPDFLMLPFHATEDRLRHATFNDGDGQNHLLFSPEAVEVLQKEAGVFLLRAKDWGIGDIRVFIPNIRENPAAQAAAEQHQVAEAMARALDVKVGTVTRHTKEMGSLGVTPDFALAATMKMSGEDIEIIHRNTPDFIGMPGAVASKIATNRKGGRNGNNRQAGNSKGSTSTSRT